MMEDGLARLITYWVSQGMNPLFLAKYGEDENVEIRNHRLERECYLAGVSLPTRAKVRDLVQGLIDKGYVIAWFEPDRWPPRRQKLRKIREASLLDKLAVYDPAEETTFELTDEGAREAERFEDFAHSSEGRRLSIEFARRWISKETEALAFSVVVPDYVPESIDPLPDIAVNLEVDTITLRYHGDTFDQIFVDQTTHELGEDDVQFESEVVKDDRIAGVHISARERQITATWVEISMGWDMGQVAYRVSYHRTTESVEDLDDAADDQSAFEDTDIPPHPFEESSEEELFEHVVIDDVMREEARKVVASIIEQT